METFVGMAAATQPPTITAAREIFQKILVATDFSIASAPAIAQAMAIARSSNAHLWIAHAIDSAGSLDRLLSEDDFEQGERSLLADVENKLRPLVDVACRDGIEAEALVLRGDPTEAIVSAARSQGADLVVMGTHGRRGMARLLLGSVASKVIAIAPCAVLTVRGKS